MHNINRVLNLLNPFPRNMLDNKALHARKVKFCGQREDVLSREKSEWTTSEYTGKKSRHVLD